MIHRSRIPHVQRSNHHSSVAGRREYRISRPDHCLCARIRAGDFCRTDRSVRIFWGDDGEDRISLAPFDGIVVPDGVLRGFTNISDIEATLLVVLGAHNTGHYVWGKAMQKPFTDSIT